LTQIAHKLHTIYFCTRILLKSENTLVGCWVRTHAYFVCYCFAFIVLV